MGLGDGERRSEAGYDGHDRVHERLAAARHDAQREDEAAPVAREQERYGEPRKQRHSRGFYERVEGAPHERGIGRDDSQGERQQRVQKGRYEHAADEDDRALQEHAVDGHRYGQHQHEEEVVPRGRVLDDGLDSVLLLPLRHVPEQSFEHGASIPRYFARRAVTAPMSVPSIAPARKSENQCTDTDTPSPM